MRVHRSRYSPLKGYACTFSQYVLRLSLIHILLPLLNERRLVMDPIVVTVIGVIVVILALFALSGIRVVQQYERGVIFILGRLQGAKGPGVFWVPPIVTRMITVDLRIVTLTVPPQEVISRDNVTIKVTAVFYFYFICSKSCAVCVM